MVEPLTATIWTPPASITSIAGNAWGRDGGQEDLAMPPHWSEQTCPRIFLANIARL
ncbi:protein of unknown function [Ralstonia solanacearum CFBP2957]|nr:protein of unknown function [Ralstonia solanacearum CFBP2957]